MKVRGIQDSFVHVKSKTGLEVTVIDYSNKGVIIVLERDGEEYGRMIVEELGGEIFVKADECLYVG